MPQSLPENLKSIAKEIETYYRELPRLLAEGEEGRHALIRGNEVVSVWDTFGDAVQAGHDKFGLEGFIAQQIRSRDLDGLAIYFESATQQGVAT